MNLNEIKEKIENILEEKLIIATDVYNQEEMLYFTTEKEFENLINQWENDEEYREERVNQDVDDDDSIAEDDKENWYYYRDEFEHPYVTENFSLPSLHEIRTKKQLKKIIEKNIPKDICSDSVKELLDEIYEWIEK